MSLTTPVYKRQEILFLESPSKGNGSTIVSKFELSEDAMKCIHQKFKLDNNAIVEWNNSITGLKDIQEKIEKEKEPRKLEKALSLVFAIIAIGILVGAFFGARAVASIRPGMELVGIGTFAAESTIYMIFSWYIGNKAEKTFAKRGGNTEAGLCCMGKLLLGTFEGIKWNWINLSKQLAADELAQKKMVSGILPKIERVFLKEELIERKGSTASVYETNRVVCNKLEEIREFLQKNDNFERFNFK